jgi:triphosphoribosyl-dephospho-CoA synthase
VSAADAISAAFKAACLDELEAPKPGNVHVFAGSRDLTAAQFVRSAEVAAGPLSRRGARVGRRILDAVEATAAAVRTNTNLGILLLCAPLAAAAESQPSDLRTELGRVIGDLDLQDADLAFRAIVLAGPAGLGRAERHDVFAPARVTLREAMTEAAGRDRIAAQYASNFADVFGFGVPLAEQALGRHGEPKWAALAVYLGFLSAFTDSHIARKHGLAAAETVRREAERFRQQLQDVADPEAMLPQLLAWDAVLKRQGLNPGTSADLAVAAMFVQRLRIILPLPLNND